jgi:4-hydroxybenzoate polyprenyltransferase
MFLITLLPSYAFLIDEGQIESSWAALLILPFLVAMAAGFTYNSVCDAKTDPKEKNPISRGDLSKQSAVLSTTGLVVLSILIFVIVYHSLIAFGFFVAYLLLWLAYSGVALRFKESVLAPVVASIVLWAGPPFILLSEFGCYDSTAMALVLGLFAVYVGHEIKHTIVEHDMDLRFGSRTFAVILGRKHSTVIEFVAVSVGYLFLLTSLSLLHEEEYWFATVFFICLFGASLTSAAVYRNRVSYNLEKDVLSATLPYVSTKVFIIVLSFMAMQESALIIFFIVWLFLLRKYP